MRRWLSGGPENGQGRESFSPSSLLSHFVGLVGSCRRYEIQLFRLAAVTRWNPACEFLRGASQAYICLDALFHMDPVRERHGEIISVPESLEHQA